MSFIHKKVNIDLNIAMGIIFGFVKSSNCAYLLLLSSICVTLSTLFYYKRSYKIISMILYNRNDFSFISNITFDGINTDISL